MIHVLPINDLKPHEETTTCHCEPNIIEESGELIVVHNSFDGREGVEVVTELLNNGQNDKPSVATKADSSNVVDQQNLPTREEIEREAEKHGSKGVWAHDHHPHPNVDNALYSSFIRGANYVLSYSIKSIKIKRSCK
ncbi:MAG TPA: hypothetical protein VEA58_07195 [Anaerovoracaceae bacterium]|nr:hypothetical protein [Anaerovoracaceae bacterium]